MPTESSGGGNPNFPFDLSISPSCPPAYSSYSEESLIDETNFGLLAQARAIQQYGIAGRVWEAAYLMSTYILPPPQIEFDPPFIDASKASQSLTVIELGSGTGVVASSLLRLIRPGSDRLIVTDLPEVCPLLENNLWSVKLQLESDHDYKTSLIVKPLSWGSLQDAKALASVLSEQGHEPILNRLTHIVCSDLVYFPELLGPLLRSLLHLTSPPFYLPSEDRSGFNPPTIFISYKIRSLVKEAPFWSAFGLWFEFRPVLFREVSTLGKWSRFGVNFDDSSFLFVASRRPESYKWSAPELYEDLLGGVGANGTGFKKSDDTFENILFMMLED